MEQLKLIEKSKESFDVVAIVRGGGSQTDFKPFDDYELAKYVANFPIPVFTGIGHDRNQSIVCKTFRTKEGNYNCSTRTIYGLSNAKR